MTDAVQKMQLFSGVSQYEGFGRIQDNSAVTNMLP